jgi:hypothetical protein
VIEWYSAQKGAEPNSNSLNGVEGGAMALLSQLVKPDVLSKLSESQITMLNSSVEAELVQNAAIRTALGGKVTELLKGMGH